MAGSTYHEVIDSILGIKLDTNLVTKTGMSAIKTARLDAISDVSAIHLKCVGPSHQVISGMTSSSVYSELPQFEQNY
jgi:hypothetical protein